MGLFRRSRANDVVIDLRDSADTPVWGSPTTCPQCSGRGYLDHIDPFREVMFLHCTVCYTKFEVAKVELDRVDA